MIFRRRFLSASALKIIAAAAMLCDHLCVILLPGQIWLRWIGRLSMPIFAFLTAEGLKRTSSRAGYIGRMAALGAVCQAAFVITGGDPKYLNIVLTYASCAAVIAAAEKARGDKRFIPAAAIAAAGYAVLLILLDFSYGWTASLIIISAFYPEKREHGLAAILIILTIYSAWCASGGYGYQAFSLLSLPLLMMYGGERGMKLPRYFFYVFYPAHLALLWILRYLLR